MSPDLATNPAPSFISFACWLAGADADARTHRMSGFTTSVVFLLCVLPVGVARKGAEREGVAGRGPHGPQATRPCARRPLSPAGAGFALSRTTAGQRSRKPKGRKGAKGPKVLKVQVLKMLAMEPTPDPSKDPVDDFLTTGRTGRRNAMADILGEHAATGSGDLSERMEGLSTDQTGAGPSTSGATAPPSTQQADTTPPSATKEASR